MVKNGEADFLSIKEMASLIKVHPNTIRRHVKTGRLNAFKLGSSYRIPRCEINKLAFEHLEQIMNSLIDKRLK